MRATPTAYGLVLVLGLNGHQVATAGVTMTELADLLHEFACELAPDASPIATVASSEASDVFESQSDVIRRALRVAEQLTQAEKTAAGAAGQVDTQLVLGRLTLDRAAYEVRVDGQPVALTFREFRLLQYLAEHPSQVLHRHELLEHVWERQERGIGRTVDVHIARLRAKLGPTAGRIITVRGVGYRFELGADGAP